MSERFNSNCNSSLFAREMSRIYQVTALAFFMLALYVGYTSLEELSFYSSLGPGAGFFPLIIAVLIGFLSAILFGQATFEGERLPTTNIATTSLTGYLRAALVIALLLIAGTILETAGFRITVFLFLIILFSVFNGGSVLLNIALAAGFSHTGYYVFVDLLGVGLPEGMWPF